MDTVGQTNLILQKMDNCSTCVSHFHCVMGLVAKKRDPREWFDDPCN